MSFVTLAEAKTYLKIDPAITDKDAFLQMQLDIICQAVEGYCRRSFALATYDQTFYEDCFTNSREVPLLMWPVKSIVSILQNGVPFTDYILNKAAGILVRQRGLGFWYGFGADYSMVVRYQAGYDVVPAPVKFVVLSLIQQAFNKDAMGVSLSFGSDVQSISIPKTIQIAFDYSAGSNERATPFGTIIGNYSNSLDYYRSDRTIIGSGKLNFVEQV